MEKDYGIMALNTVLCPGYEPITAREIATLLGAKTKKKQKDVCRALKGYEKQGLIKRNASGQYLPAHSTLIKGIYKASQKSFGFVSPADPEEADIFIPSGKMGSAFDGDEVSVRITKEARGAGKKREGEVVGIDNRNHTRVVGTMERKEKYCFVRPDDKRIGRDIFVPLERSKGAKTHYKVICEITKFNSDKGRCLEGKVVDILGHENDLGVDILSIAEEMGLPGAFPDEVLAFAEKMAVPVTEKDREGRLDLRDVPMVTIDGIDAKDLDDALSLEMEGNLYKLGIHIADVSHYVPEGSVLDKEAQKRCNSFYLVDRVIPMLPTALSNEMCSLNAGEERLAMTCLCWIDKTGAVKKHEIHESLVRIDQRMNYTDVKKILDDRDPELLKRDEKFVPMLQNMADLAKILRTKRQKRGAVDFMSTEVEIILNAAGEPVDFKKRTRDVATNLVEEFMLIANEIVAEAYAKRELPFVFRTHGEPDAERIQALKTLLEGYGLTLRAKEGEVTGFEIQSLLNKVKGRPEAYMINQMTLRAMQRAAYKPENDGHFGLAAHYYCHFTAPIRRYADLQIHRIIKEHLRGRLSQKRIEHYSAVLPSVCEACSNMERKADEAERETEKYKKVEYMQKHLGETFTGVISGVTSWGLYVELPNTIEGLVHISNIIGDYYNFVPDKCAIIGERFGKTFTLGETISVNALRADLSTRTIDFVIAAEEKKKHGKTKRH